MTENILKEAKTTDDSPEANGTGPGHRALILNRQPGRPAVNAQGA